MAKRKEIKTIPVTFDLAQELMPPRPRAVDKEYFGRALVIAGAKGMLGAALLSSRAVLRVGAGISVLGVPRELAKVADAVSPEVMTLELPMTAKGTVSVKARASILKMASRMRAVALGPGLSRDPATKRLLKHVLPGLFRRYAAVRLVIDADGLLGMVRFPFRGAERLPIITPHTGELAKLIKVTRRAVESDRLRYARSAARRFNVIVVLKGAMTLIVSPVDDVLFYNMTGNPGMATGGSGDVLTGIITGLLAQGLEPRTAAALGVYVHGLAGNFAAVQKGEDGIIASDILENIPNALRRLRGK